MRLTKAYKSVLPIVLLILLSGCSAHKSEQIPANIARLKNLAVIPADAKPAYRISFKKGEAFGNTKKVLIGQISHIAVDDSGRVFIADGQKKTIDVFEPDGSYFTHFGRKGKGPGEFMRMGDFQIKNDKLFAAAGGLRYNVFSLDSINLLYSSVLATNRSNFQGLHDAASFPVRLEARNDGSILAEYTKENIHKKAWSTYETNGFFYLLNQEGMITSKLFEAPYTTMIFVRWPPVNPNMTVGMNLKSVYGKSNVILSPDNHIYWAGPDTFLIKIFSTKGVYQQAIYYPYKKVPLTKQSASAVKVSKYLIQNMALPKTWPVLNDMMIDNQNHLWVSTIVKDMKVYQWWVLNRNGKLLARFNWPRSKPIKVVKNGYVYTQQTDTTTGVQKILRYRMIWKPFGQNK